jgi:signal transduction histidine kinase
MLIIVLSFAVVVVTTVSVVGNYAMNAKKDVMRNFAEVAQAYMESMVKSANDKSLENIVLKNGEDIAGTLEHVAVSLDDVSVLIFDADGTILVHTQNDKLPIDVDEPLPKTLRDALMGGEESVSDMGVGEGIFRTSKIVEARSIRSDDGEILGFAVVCSGSAMIGDVLNVIIRIVSGSILWVLVASLIAVYVISERVIAPLREISSAAKRFASGKFDVRVPVRGSDEVAELADTFNHMAESLDNYDNMRNSFMSNVSHDLRSPMTSIAGFIDGILDGVIPPEQHTYYLQVVSSEVKRLSRLVNSLLDLSRIQAGERKFTPIAFDICETARQILISFEQKIDTKHLDVEFECEADRMMANADPDAIHQVLYNLIDNAVKFAKEDGKFAITLKYIKGKKIVVEVFNEGQGISSADINYVFERFYKSDKSRGLNKNGAGLGLFISKTIIDAHGEEIWVNSEYGKNCCFGFTLSSE